MSKKDDLMEHLERIVKDAEEHLERLRTAVAQGIRVAHVDMEQRLKRFESICAEHRRLMSEHFSK
jgi:hypothetical protein